MAQGGPSWVAAAYQPVPPAPMILVTIGKLFVNARGCVLCGRCTPQCAGEGHPSCILLVVVLSLEFQGALHTHELVAAGPDKARCSCIQASITPGALATSESCPCPQCKAISISNPVCQPGAFKLLKGVSKDTTTALMSQVVFMHGACGSGR